MKKVCVSLGCLILLGVFGFDLCAAADWREGKEAYRTVCTSCHKTRGDAGRLSLNSRTRDEWSVFFAQAPIPVHQKVWEKLDKDSISSLEQYFRKYAKDVKELSG